MPIPHAAEKIISTALTWQGLTVHPHRFGGTEFLLGKRELGHIHGNSLMDIPLPLKIRDELVEAERVQPHHILPKSGWVSFYIRESSDIEKGIELLRMSYDIASKSRRER